MRFALSNHGGLLMSLKSVLQKLKPKEKPQIHTKETPEKKPDSKASEPSGTTPMDVKHEPKPVKEYHETLYTKGHAPKEKKLKAPTKQDTQWKPKHWEGINTIEKNVDTIHIKDNDWRSTPNTKEETDIERKVDMIIKKNKDKI